MKYINNNQIAKEYKKLLIDENIKAVDVCEKIGIMPQSYQRLLGKKQLSFSDMQKLLDVIGYDLEINFVKR